jgi:hypothetical protein
VALPAQATLLEDGLEVLEEDGELPEDELAALTSPP